MDQAEYREKGPKMTDSGFVDSLLTISVPEKILNALMLLMLSSPGIGKKGLEMNQISAVSLRYDQLKSRIVQDVLPWKETAYKVQWSLVLRSYELLPEAPLEIDVFDAEKNSENIWARYSTYLENTCSPLCLKSSLKKLKTQVQTSEIITFGEKSSKAIKINLDLLDRQGVFKSFIYVLKW